MKRKRKGRLLAALGLAPTVHGELAGEILESDPVPKRKWPRVTKEHFRPNWTEEQSQFLREHWGKLPPQEIADRLGRTKPSVVGRAGKLGLRRKKPPNWSAEEREYLETNWGRAKLPTIAKKLGRTETAVLLKSKCLGLGPTKFHPDIFNARELSDAVGADIHAVTNYWIPKCGLPAHRRVTKKTFKFWRIRIGDFWAWAERNQDKFYTRRFRKGALGPEPAWMELKRQRDRRLPARWRQKWTPREDQRLMLMFKAGKPYRAIAAELGRTREGVQRRLSRLGWANVWNGNSKMISGRE